MALFHTTVLDNQIKALDTIGSVSGAICTFETDKAERLVNLEVAITATGGGGTPVSPISILGHDNASIFNNSVNVWNETTKNGYYNASNGNYVYNAGQLCSKGLIKVQPDTAYFYYKPNSQTSGDILFFGSNGVYLNSYYLNKGNSTFTTPNNCYYIAINLGSNYGASYNNDVSVNNDGSTTYNAFSGSIVDFGQTVYGGRLNVGSGVLTITHGYVDLGGLTWRIGYDVNRFVTSDLIGTLEPPIDNDTVVDVKCSIYSPISINNMINNAPNNTIAVATSSNLSILDDRYSSETDFKTAVNGIIAVYKLATPTIIQLDSKQIQAIIGTNNIYADTGDIIDLKFILSVGQAIS